jgi:hypothetical protein
MSLIYNLKHLIYKKEGCIRDLTNTFYSDLQKKTTSPSLENWKREKEQQAYGRHFTCITKWLLRDRVDPAIEAAWKANEFVRIANKGVARTQTEMIYANKDIIKSLKSDKRQSELINCTALYFDKLKKHEKQLEKNPEDQLIRQIQKLDKAIQFNQKFNHFFGELHPLQPFHGNLIKTFNECIKNPEKAITKLSTEQETYVLKSLTTINEILKKEDKEFEQIIASCNQPLQAFLREARNNKNKALVLTKAVQFFSVHLISKDEMLVHLTDREAIGDYISHKYPALALTRFSYEIEHELNFRQHQLSYIISENLSLFDHFPFENKVINDIINKSRATIPPLLDYNADIQNQIKNPTQTNAFILNDTLYHQIEKSKDTKLKYDDMPILDLYNRDCIERFTDNTDIKIKIEESDQSFSYQKLNDFDNSENKSMELREFISHNLYNKGISDLHYIAQWLVTQDISVGYIKKKIFEVFEQYITCFKLHETELIISKDKNKIDYCINFTCCLDIQNQFFALENITAFNANVRATFEFKDEQWIITSFAFEDPNLAHPTDQIDKAIGKGKEVIERNI